MKCEHCNGNISLEDAFCPYCGQPNTQAQKHAADMQKYHGEFEETKEYVHAKNAATSKIMVKIITLCVLLLLSVLFIFLSVNAYHILRGQKIKYANRKYEEYSTILDGYLERQEYLEFNAFVTENHISFYDSPYDSKYRNISIMVGSYSAVFFDLWRYTYADTKISSRVDCLSSNLEYFYERCTKGVDSFYGEDYTEYELEIADSLIENVKLMLLQYTELTEEEIDSFPTMSKTKRAVLLEDKLEEMSKDEEK